MMRCPRHFFKFPWLIFLSVCEDGDMVVLKDYMNQMYARKNMEVLPLPECKPIPNYFYGVDKMRDSFMSFLGLDPLPSPPRPEGDKNGKDPRCPCSDPFRIRTGLELIPLDALTMVGVVREESQPKGALWESSWPMMGPFIECIQETI